MRTMGRLGRPTVLIGAALVGLWVLVAIFAPLAVALYRRKVLR